MSALTPRLNALDRPNIRSSEGAGTTTLSSSDYAWQIFNLTAARTCVLPSTGIVAGQRIFIQNRTFFELTLQASNGSALTVANSCNMHGSIQKGSIELIALQATPTTPAHWFVVSVEDQGTFGVTFTQTGGFSQAVTVTYNRIGRSVTLRVPSFGGTTTAASAMTGSVSIPTGIRPPTNVYKNVPVTNSGAELDTPGVLAALSDGRIMLWRAWITNNFTSGAYAGLLTSGGPYAASLNYLLD